MGRRIRQAVRLGLVLTVATPAAAAWQEASSRHFLVYSDDAPERVRAFADKLERYDKAMRVLRDVPDPAVSPSARVTVFVVSGVDAVQKLAGSRDVAGFYTPRASQSVAFVPRTDVSNDVSALTILLHEYTHHFTFATWGRSAMPAWLIEGLAEYHSAAKFRPDGGVTLGGAAQGRAHGLLSNDVMPAERLLTARPGTLNREQTGVFYARAWLLTHYLTMDKERRGQLSRYIAAVNAGKPAAVAAAELGDPKALDRALNTYARQRYLSAFSLAADRLATPPVTVRPLTAGEAAVMPARLRSVRGVDPKTAPGVAEQARRLAAPYPGDAGAQNVLAEAEYDAGDHAAARAAAERALAADPKSVHAMMYAGMAAVAEAAAAKSADAERWRTARAWFTRANRAEVEYAWPLQMFYSSFVAARQVPTANAQAGLLYAHELAPFDTGLGMTAAYVLLKQGKGQEASTVLRPMAYNPHGGGAATAAGLLLAAVDHGGPAAALALMEGPRPAAASAAAKD